MHNIMETTSWVHLLGILQVSRHIAGFQTPNSLSLHHQLKLLWSVSFQITMDFSDADKTWMVQIKVKQRRKKLKLLSIFSKGKSVSTSVEEVLKDLIFSNSLLQKYTTRFFKAFCSTILGLKMMVNITDTSLCSVNANLQNKKNPIYLNL